MPCETFLIWGAGGHGAVVADAIRCAGHRVLGFVDANAAKIGAAVEPGGATVILAEQQFLEHLRLGRALPPGASALALGIGDNHTRRLARTQVMDVPMPVVIHPAATMSSSACLGAGTVVMARAVVNPRAHLGAGVIINSGAVVEHDCRVGDDAHVSPGAVLTGGVSVGQGSWIGAGAVILPGVVIGAGAIVGAGAVVLHDVERGATVVGNPAKVKTSRMRS